MPRSGTAEGEPSGRQVDEGAVATGPPAVALVDEGEPVSAGVGVRAGGRPGCLRSAQQRALVATAMTGPLSPKPCTSSTFSPLTTGGLTVRQRVALKNSPVPPAPNAQSSLALRVHTLRRSDGGLARHGGPLRAVAAQRCAFIAHRPDEVRRQAPDGAERIRGRGGLGLEGPCLVLADLAGPPDEPECAVVRTPQVVQIRRRRRRAGQRDRGPARRPAGFFGSGWRPGSLSPVFEHRIICVCLDASRHKLQASRSLVP